MNKYVADCTGLSRRAADQVVAEGRVLVNRKPATTGQSVNPEKDVITLDGARLKLQRKTYIIMNKPPGVITTKSDPQGRKTIYDLLPTELHHLDPVGRLDRDSSGVLLLSNDGQFVQHLSHPSKGHRKIYRVSVTKKLTPKTLETLSTGVMLMPEAVLAKCEVQEVIDEYTVVLALKTGLNRQIRRCLEALGYNVKTLKRTQLAGLSLGRLKPGEHRELKPSELKQLFQAGAKQSREKKLTPKAPSSPRPKRVDKKI